ncbi:MAG TPA: DUF899 family protein [Burkholderiales bacterium]|nr:DUF899 family protein [Burkholderiales bacterium]
MATKAKRKPAVKPLHAVRYPGESGDYRKARNRLLKAEIELRRHVEQVAALRRKLPTGGVVPEDYEFEEGAADLADTQTARRVRLSGLFAPGRNTLVVYSFMYGPRMKHACPMCTAMLDSLNGTSPHASQRINLVVVAKSPLERIRTYARGRGWRNLRLLSSAGNSYNRDYHAETGQGGQLPALNVFVKRGGKIRHFFGTEMLYVREDPGQNARHVDMIWPLWNLFDFTPEGRGSDWYPQLSYGA